MLDALRRGSTGYVAKLLFAVLVVSFAIWGIGPVFRNYGHGVIAKVGSHEVRMEDFQRNFQNEVRLISRQSGRRITTEQARAAGLDQQILAQLLAWAAVESHANELDLAISDEKLAEGIRGDAAFKGPDGRFSRINFENVLSQLGLSERSFMQLRRRDELRQQVTSALMNSVHVPEGTLELMNTWRNEKRVVEYFTIDPEKAVKVPEPDDAKLQATYEANKRDFMVPEQRKLGILELSIESLKKKVDVSDAEISANYEETQKDYNTPERRRAQQIAFKDKAAAEAAKKALASGKAFGEVAKEAGAKDTDIDLGLVSKDRLIDPTIADAIFALKKDQVSGVIEGRFATVIARVTDIQPAVNRTLNDVKGDVRDKLAKQKAQAQLQSMIDQVEDQRNAGKSLKDIADQLKLEYIEVPSTDRLNKTPDGKAALSLPDALAIINSAFETQMGIDNEPVELREGGYAWVNVLGITEGKQKPFDEVKADVKKLAIEQERTRLVNELATKLVEKADAGTPMATLATEGGAEKLETSQPFTRQTEPHGLPKDAVSKAFVTAKGKANSAAGSDNKTRVVFKVTEVTPAPALTKEERLRLSKELKEHLTDELLSEYVIALQKRLGTHINEAEYKRATGAGATETQ
jgi:peptidyl-prolyl cis-trans isomerase D